MMTQQIVMMESDDLSCHLPTAGPPAEMRWKPEDRADDCAPIEPVLLLNSVSYSRRAALIMFQQPAERLVADDFLQSELIDRHWRQEVGVDGHVAEPRRMRKKKAPGKAVSQGGRGHDTVPGAIGLSPTTARTSARIAWSGR